MTAVVPAAGCDNVSVEVTAKAAASTQALVRANVTATVAGAGATALATVNITTGRIAGMIEAFIAPVGASLPELPTITAPIAEVADFLAQLETALSGITDIGLFTTQLKEPVNLSLNLSANLSQLSLGATATACGSSISLTAGEVRRNAGVHSFANGNAAIGGCFSSGVMTVGDIERDLIVNGLDGADIRVSAGTVRNVNIGAFNAAVQSSTVRVIAASMAGLGIQTTSDSNITVQGNIATHLELGPNTHLTLGSLSGGDLRNFAITSSAFSASPSITVGNLVAPGSAGSFPKGDVRIEDNIGLSLGSITMGNIAGDLTITGNQGFGNDAANSFAAARSVGGVTSISNNLP